MSTPFDPYVKWLGIRTPERPPNHYLLLGLTPFEADADVIDAAANRQMAHVRTYQTGAQSAISQRVLNELAAARVHLLNPEKKAAYDANLRAQVAQLQTAAISKPSTDTVSTATKELRTRSATKSLAPTVSQPKTQSGKSAQGGRQTLVLGGLAIVGVLTAVVVAFVLLPGEVPPVEATGQTDAGPGPSKSNTTPNVQASTSEPTTPIANSPPSTPAAQIDTSPPTTSNLTVETEPEPKTDPMPASTVSAETPATDQGVAEPADEVQTVADQGESESTTEQASEDSVETPAESDVPARKPLPDSASRQASLKSVQQIFQEELSKAKTSATQSALAAQLLQQARESQENATDQFVLLAEALRLATEAGDVDTALQAWDESVVMFDVDVLGGTAKVLTNLSKRVKANNQQQSLAQRAGEVFDAALATDKLELASELAELAAASAKKGKDPELAKVTALRLKQFQNYKQLATDAAAAQKTLKSKPDDPQANLAQGRFLCLGRDNWKAGLPLLAKSPESPLRKAAEGDLKAGNDAKSWIARGDAWFELAKTAEEFEPRAAYWYRRGVGEVSGLEQARVEKRLAGLTSTGLIVRPEESYATSDEGLSSASMPASKDSPGAVTAEQIVLWNAPSNQGDVATKLCHVLLLLNEQPVWTKRNLTLPWSRERDEKVVLDIPKVRFDTVRVEAIEWERVGPALCEVEVLSKGKNIARGARVRVSGFHDKPEYAGQTLVDGVTSPGQGEYFWVPQTGRRGWAEIDLRQPTTGIVADRLVIWNQHNGVSNNRGSHECNVALLLGQKEVWRQDKLTIPWTADRDEKLELPLPKKEFNRVRVEITKYDGSAGLAEIEVWRGKRNLALGVPARTNGVWGNNPFFLPERVTDGITSNNRIYHGYWLAPDGWPAWIEVDLDLPVAQPSAEIKGDRLVLWNQRNGDHNYDFVRGVDHCDIVFYDGPREVERREHVRIPWSAEIDANIALSLPRVPFTRVRVDLTSWLGRGGGLAEIELFRKGQNIAPQAKASASAIWGEGYEAERAVDGITTATSSPGGFWLLPDGTPGWIELDFGSKR